MKNLWRVIHGLMFIALCAGFAVAALSIGGCSKNKNTDGKTAATVESGFATSAAGVKGLGETFDAMDAANPPEPMKPLIAAGRNHLDTVKSGEATAKKACDESVKQNETGRQGYYRTLNFGTIAAGIIIALAVVLIVNGNKFGYGLAAGGAALTGVFIFLRDSSPVFPFIMWAMGGIVVVTVVYLVFEKLRARREMAKEKLATKEGAKIIDLAKARLPEYARKEMFGDGTNPGSVSAIQSATTEALFDKAREENKKERNGGAAAEISGVVIGTTTGPVTGTVTPGT